MTFDDPWTWDDVLDDLFAWSAWKRMIKLKERCREWNRRWSKQAPSGTPSP